MTITEVARYYESELPITNAELYDVVNRVTIGELNREGLSYLGNSLNSIRLKRIYGEGSLIHIRNYKDIPPIAIVLSKDISENVNTLSRLFKMGLKEVIQEKLR